MKHWDQYTTPVPNPNVSLEQVWGMFDHEFDLAVFLTIPEVWDLWTLENPVLAARIWSRAKLILRCHSSMVFEVLDHQVVLHYPDSTPPKQLRTQLQYRHMRYPVKNARRNSLRPTVKRDRDFIRSHLSWGEWSRRRGKYGRVQHRLARKHFHKKERRYQKSLCHPEDL